jgi:hypothetical protein
LKIDGNRLWYNVALIVINVWIWKPNIFREYWRTWNTSHLRQKANLPACLQVHIFIRVLMNVTMRCQSVHFYCLQIMIWTIGNPQLPDIFTSCTSSN